MTTPDPLALAEEAEEWVSGFTSPAARELTAVVMVRCLAAALRAAHEENQRLREATGGLVPPRWASLVEVSDEIAAELLAAPSRPVTVRLERRDDGRLEVLFQQHECTPTPDPLALAEENQRLREALRPFAHPDLREILSGNRCGGASIVFGRNKALLTINDFVRADAALTGGKGEP